MAAKQKIIIYGGAFDPPHKGHFALIRAALEQMSPAALYLVPGFSSPFKGFPAAPYKDRAGMLKDGLKAEGLMGRHKGTKAQCLCRRRKKGLWPSDGQRHKGIKTRITVHPFEFKRRRLTYTCQTVDFFKKLHPNAELYFLLGSDCVETFHKWKNYRRILSRAVLLAGRRAGFGLKNPAGAPYVLLKGRFPLIASAVLKAGLFSGLQPRGLLPSTFSYIDRKGLYLGALRRRLKKTLTPARFAHTSAVTGLALELSLRYGADPFKAALAGLLHDAARGLSPRTLVRCAAKNRLRAPRLNEMIKKAPVLLHSYAGADLAAKRFGVKDRSVLNAIRQHTLGSRNPDLLSKILYVADLAACDRSFPEAGEVAALARKDLDAAYLRANYVKLIYAFRTGGWRHPESAKVWTRLRTQEKNK
ncbi:MAG: bis(5'-nucleosyl)-tetraphosphatase (symmetrical) YqeK [Elusimicrobia bacterium]|nr:bis(5'-nucleosyl)-tetraphosphatase (symmetrical) YqeK [Elusimicrobiota bacterium]